MPLSKLPTAGTSSPIATSPCESDIIPLIISPIWPPLPIKLILIPGAIASNALSDALALISAIFASCSYCILAFSSSIKAGEAAYRSASSFCASISTWRKFRSRSTSTSASTLAISALAKPSARLTSTCRSATVTRASSTSTSAKPAAAVSARVASARILAACARCSVDFASTSALAKSAFVSASTLMASARASASACKRIASADSLSFIKATSFDRSAVANSD